MVPFRVYDIRGVYPTDIDEELAYKVGRAFVVFTQAKEVAVGRDMRESSPSLYKELVQGILDQGANVVSLGMCTTPMVNFAVASRDIDAGIMISASHNPKEYNAFKLIGKKAIPIWKGNGMLKIRDLALENKFEDAEKGTYVTINILEEYLTYLRKFCDQIKDIKVVVDYGNGVGALSATPLLKGLNIETTELYAEPDGTFPNHPANTHDVENFHDLQQKVIESSADIGLFFDGDADRVVVVDERGEIIHSDLLVGLLAKEELLKRPNERVYFDLRFSKSIGESIKKHSGIPITMPVGSPYYKEKMINEGGVLAGEFSGHIMFQDNFGIDDGLFASIKVMALICKYKRPISDLVKPLQKCHSSPEINMKVPNTLKVFNGLAAKYNDGRYEFLDGLSVHYPEWWFNVRKSNNEPLVRVRIEADTLELLKEKQKEIVSFIQGI